jgi:hypothetical protein
VLWLLYEGGKRISAVNIISMYQTIESIRNMVEDIEEYYKEALAKYNYKPLKKSNERLEEPDDIEKRKQHQNMLEQKYGFGMAYGILKLFERYEELKAASPTKDIEEIEKLIVKSLIYFNIELSDEKAFIKKYRLESKINEEIKQQNEKKLARIREERRPELERKYGKGKSIEELLKLESDEKRRVELKRKYGTGKSLEELERLEKLERLQIIKVNHVEENGQYYKDLYG